MTNYLETLRRWRVYAPDRRLSLRLMAVGFPISLREAFAGATTPDPVLIRWTREKLAAGWILRTAQAERLAEGRSLAEVATTTGVSLRVVLHTISTPDWEKTDG